MNADTQASIAKNWDTILNNFKKITGWIIKGDTPENPMKGALKEAKDKFDALIANDDEQNQRIVGLTNSLSDKDKQIADLTKQLESLQNAVADLDTRVNNIGDPTNPVEPKKEKEAESTKAAKATKPAKSTKATKPKEDKPAKDDVQVTAEAIGAGDISESATAQVDDLLDAL